MPNPPPRARWFPGYTVAAIAAIGQVFSAPGQTLLLSLLNLPLRQALGLDALQLNSTYTGATILASLPLVMVGRITDRVGPRRALVCVAILFGAACLFMATVQTVVMLALGFFGLRLLGQGSLTLVSQHALAMWFHRRLGTITGLLTVVMFAAWAVLPTLIQRAIDVYGWRSTWTGMGVLVALVVGGLALGFLRDRPEDLGLQLDGDTTAPTDGGVQLDRARARKTPAYWILATGITLSAMIATAVMFDMQPLMAARGLDRTDAARLIGLWGLSMAVLALPVGALVDRATPASVCSGGCGSLGLGCIVLALSHTHGAAAAAVVLLAIGQSLLSAGVGATTARFFGRSHHGAIRSGMTRMAVIGTGIGPLAFGLADRLVDSHVPALLAFATLCVPTSIAALRLRAPASAG